MNAHESLRERLTDDYGLALLVDGDLSPDAAVGRFAAGDGVPVLSMARGALGVLRAMQVRTGPLRLQDEPRVARTLAYIRKVESRALLEMWSLTPKGRSPDGTS